MIASVDDEIHPFAKPSFKRIVCADWSMYSQGRAVYVACADERTIQRVEGASWTLDALINECIRQPNSAPLLIGIDVPIGIPRSFATRSEEISEFTRWLRATVCDGPNFFRVCDVLADWTLNRPFFGVVAGKGGYSRWLERMREQGVEPLREIDRWTAAKPLFITHGIPGSVGSSVCDIWPGILKNRRRVSVWPFDGFLQELIDPARPVLAEIYPRALYGIALTCEKNVDARPRLSINKNNKQCRKDALDSLIRQDWVHQFNVTIKSLDCAVDSADDFDALMSAAALQRCLLEETSLESTYRHHFEGGMLASLSLNIHLPEKRFICGRNDSSPRPSVTNRPRRLRTLTPASRHCPIAGCSHFFSSGRGGWDAHAASVRIHPMWHPEVRSHVERKRLFRFEFPEFFED